VVCNGPKFWTIKHGYPGTQGTETTHFNETEKDVSRIGFVKLLSLLVLALGTTELWATVTYQVGTCKPAPHTFPTITAALKKEEKIYVAASSVVFLGSGNAGCERSVASSDLRGWRL
jgi:hypothetical protein